MRGFFLAIICLSMLCAAVFGQTPVIADESVGCPKDLQVTISQEFFNNNDIVTATAAFIGEKYQPTLNWKVSGGEIIEGQGTRQLKIRYIGDALTATVFLGAIPTNCSDQTASASIIICAAPKAVLHDEYDIIPFRIRKERLDNFVVQWQNQPGARLLVAVESAASDSQNTRIFLNRTYGYLVNARGVDPEAIEFAIKNGAANKIQLYVVPQGAQMPLENDGYNFINGKNLPLKFVAPPQPKRKKRS